MNKITIAVIWLSLWMLGMAHASSVSVQGGWQHSSSSAYGDAVNTGVRVEQPIAHGIGLGAEYEHHGSIDWNGYGRMSGDSLLAIITYRPEVDWYAKPYILYGGGWSWWNFDTSEDMEGRGITVDVGNTNCQKFAVGAEYEVRPNWFLGLEWAFFQADVPKESYYSDGSPAEVVGDSKVGKEELCLGINLRHKF